MGKYEFYYTSIYLFFQHKYPALAMGETLIYLKKIKHVQLELTTLCLHAQFYYRFNQC